MDTGTVVFLIESLALMLGWYDRQDKGPSYGRGNQVLFTVQDRDLGNRYFVINRYLITDMEL